MPTSHVLANGLHFHVAEWGSREQPPLVLLHGLASTHRMFHLIIPALAERFHLLAFDQRGHGLSDKPDSGYDFETIASDLDGVVAALGHGERPFRLYGHSWGAYTTLYYAATRPKRVERAVLLDGGIHTISDMYPTWEIAREKMSPPDYANTTLHDIERMIREQWLLPIYRPELEPLALSIFDTRNPNQVKAHLSRDNHLQIAKALWEFQPRHYYPQIGCPLLMVKAIPPGEPISPEVMQDAQRLKQEASQASIVWMQDTVHDIPWHRPDQLLDQLVQFGF
ncbi:MAG: alpha/beta hydrolase [Chloroflexota bacterium]|nr:alpha/beta hydrolase [Chloroflexota bacterium]